MKSNNLLHAPDSSSSLTPTSSLLTGGCEAISCSFLSLRVTNSAKSFFRTNSPADMEFSPSAGGLTQEISALAMFMKLRSHTLRTCRVLKLVISCQDGHHQLQHYFWCGLRWFFFNIFLSWVESSDPENRIYILAVPWFLLTIKWAGFSQLFPLLFPFIPYVRWALP